MNSTVKIYDSKPYCQTFSAQVLSCVVCEGGWRVVLDRTAFFPGGGGQDPDRGSIGSCRLVGIFEEKGIIYHILDGPIPIGSSVKGSIDWDFRFTNMQNHSGEHILSGIVHSEMGYDNVGFHMNDRFITIDFNGPMSDEEALRMELLANRRIYDNLPILISHPSAEELSHMKYRSKKELSGDVRIVQVGDVDICACCAPHVAHTGEVGLIKIIARENYKGGVRLTVLCGERALLRFRQQTETLSELCAMYSAMPERLTEACTREQEELAAQKESIGRLSDEIVEARTALLANGRASVFHYETLLDDIAARKLANRLSQAVCGRTAVLTARPEGGYHYILASSAQDIRPFTAAWNSSFNGRGGGSEHMTQGAVSGSLEEMKAFFEGYED